MGESAQQWPQLPTFLQFNKYFSLGTMPRGDANSDDLLTPNFGQILRSKRVRVVATAFTLVLAIGYLFNNKLYIPDYASFHPSSHSSTVCVGDSPTDWSRFAYVQYVTNEAYLCNSVMLFETLHRLGSKADRLMMYPNNIDLKSDSHGSKLLQKAQDNYSVKLMPIEVQHRDGGDYDADTWADSYTKLLAFNQTQYDRVLSLDSDSTVLQHMDELFLLPPAPVAMPRAYWLNQPFLSSQLVLIQPSTYEFARIEEAIQTAKGGDFDMEIVNNLYNNSCIIIPHRRYDVLTGEFRGKGSHASYLGNTYETWDPEVAFKEAKFLHFSDWPVPKPWIDASDGVIEDNQPKCKLGHDNVTEDCRARALWLGFYADFKARRHSVCDLGSSKIVPRSLEERMPGRYEFVLS